MTPSLISRLEAAEEGSTELSCDISIALGEWSPPRGAARDAKRPDVWRRASITHYHPFYEVTTSLDAALALAERVLGGEIAMDLLADVLDADEAHIQSVSDLPRLLCAAILRVKGSDQ